MTRRQVVPAPSRAKHLLAVYTFATTTNNDMNSALPAAQHQIYPRRYFDKSPTWFQWNKLTVADVSNLRQEPGFEGQNIYFYKNHPIQFIRLVGVIVQIDIVGNGRFCLMTLDDGSGANIEVKVERKKYQATLNQVDYLSATNVEGEELEIFIRLSLPVLRLDHSPLEIGDVIRAQGTLTEFRNQKQLLLRRVYRVRYTNEEAEHWQKAAEWKKDRLDRPWILTQAQRDEVDDKIRQGEIKEKLKAKSLAKHEKKRKRHEARREEARQAEEVKMNAGALKGSEILVLPWN
ncbi:Hypothetical predicted protein [Lecanosticta acicola]|uniref:CST complex subunit STN1 n=1 Tax=Lecanosticta acicola TaxID=111012 RepID=A0AAI8YUB4_9PEZI|nr:Hypothetical predicted protein [Lecanosticta acicola]